MKENIIKTLKQLMSYQTTDGNNKEFNKLFNYIKSIIPNYLYIEEYEFNDYKSLVISNTKDKKLDLVFCTHIDVVPAEEYKIEETETLIKGRGSFDMKGSVATALELFKDLKINKKVALFITSDEEMTGNCVKQLLTIYEPSFAIVPDGGKNHQLVIEEKGQLQIKISIKTKSAHASQPYNGVNAIESLYKIYEELIKKYPQPKSSKDYITSINLSMLNGGEAPNSVAASANMVLDIRHTSKNTKEEFIEEIKKLNKNVEIEIMQSGSLFKADINNKNIKGYIKASEDVLKKKIEIISTEATSDAIYFSDKGIPTVLTNPVGDYAHCPEEYVEKESLYNMYKIWKKVLEEE